MHYSRREILNDFALWAKSNGFFLDIGSEHNHQRKRKNFMIINKNSKFFYGI